ncbi:ankyrin repeat-containing domain protein [Aspergillus granulosus]|uniref:Ankyrin repeat-containing domain protein n=1 Tax=Aspergillus granulosus TaxID=176169 RepID=A0ABR4GRI1_9EURO
MDFYTPLEAGLKHVEVVRILLEAGASCNLDFEGTARLACSGNLEQDTLDLLVQHGLDLGLEQYGKSILHWACAHGAPTSAIDLLITRGLSRDAQDEPGNSPLMSAIRYHMENQSEKSTNFIRWLLHKSAFQGPCDNSGTHPLHYAAIMNDVEITRMLLDEFKADVNVCDNEGYTPLTWAIVESSNNVAETLLQAGALVATTAAPGVETPLHVAMDGDLNILRLVFDTWVSQVGLERPNLLLVASATLGDLEMMRKLLPLCQTDADSDDYNTKTALIYAARNNQDVCIELLLDRLSDITTQDKHGYTALEWGMMNPQSSEAILEQLIQRTRIENIDLPELLLNAVGDHSAHTVGLILDLLPAQFDCELAKMALDAAANLGKGDVCRALLNRIDRSTMNLYQCAIESALKNAAHSGHLNVVKVLIEHEGALVMASAGRDALIEAAKESHPEIMIYLIGAGADVRTQARLLEEAAARNGNLDILKLLYAWCPGLGQYESYPKRTILSYATQGGHIEMAEFLIQTHHVDIHQRDLAGKTALSYAALGGQSEMVDCLVGLGAEVDAIDSKGRTPLFSAATHEASIYLPRRSLASGQEIERAIQRRDQTVLALLRHGADVNHRGPDGESALLENAASNRKDMVQLLLEHDANRFLPDIHGKTALNYAWSDDIIKMLYAGI